MWPLMLAAVVGVIASFGVAIVGTLVTEPLASAPIESGPYVLQADGTQKLERGWLWPAPAEWGKPIFAQVQRNWVAAREIRMGFRPLVPGEPVPGDMVTMRTTEDKSVQEMAASQERLTCGWPAPIFEVRDPQKTTAESHKFSFASWRFQYRPVQSSFLIFPPAPKTAGGVSLAKEIPTRIYWPGLVVNTVFFGVLFLVMFILPGRAKIARRRRLGLCLACGYDLAGLARCPECGLTAHDEGDAARPRSLHAANSAAAPSPVP